MSVCDSFGLDMIPEVDMREMEDEDNDLAGNLPAPHTICCTQLRSSTLLSGDQESRATSQTWMWRIWELLRRL